MKRNWTLAAAREMVGEVRARTARAVAAVELLDRRLELLLDEADGEDPGEREALAAELRDRLSRWMREMEALGVAVRGPWQVEFEAELGSFSWAWPEERLERFRPAKGSDSSSIQ